MKAPLAGTSGAWWHAHAPRYIDHMTRRSFESGRGRPDEGFSLLELLVVMLIVGVTVGIGVMGYRTYAENTAARRAAEVFAMDLSLARSAAVRERRPVTVEFDEANLVYRIETGEGRLVRMRDFSAGGEIRLGSIALVDPAGGVFEFSPRGHADLSGTGSGLGMARFVAGGGRYQVTFNALGTSRVEPF